MTSPAWRFAAQNCTSGGQCGRSDTSPNQGTGIGNGCRAGLLEPRRYLGELADDARRAEDRLTYGMEIGRQRLLAVPVADGIAVTSGATAQLSASCMLSVFFFCSRLGSILPPWTGPLITSNPSRPTTLSTRSSSPCASAAASGSTTPTRSWRGSS